MTGHGRRVAALLQTGPAFLRFATVGAITTLLDLALFAAFTGIGHLAPAAANIMSYCCGIAASFVLNRNWTFNRAGGAGPAFHEAIKFALTYGAGLVLSTILVYLLAQAMPALIAKIVSVPIVLVWNFGMARHWVFKRDTSGS
ncbi:MAG: GtrA family protein [Aestuariivirga sp.]